METAATPPFASAIPARALLVADSFRARAHGGVAEVRGLALHLARFRAAVVAAAVSPIEQDLDDFIASALPQIAEAGDGFPRLELWHDSAALSLALALRPLPTLRDDIALASTERPSAVTDPEVKGPNIAAYAALAAQLDGEALLLDEAGRAIEGTTTSLVWWHADGTGGVSAAPDRVASVTEQLVVRMAHGFGDSIATEYRTPLELTGLEVWAVNALHGIRPVVSIDGQAPTRHDPDRIARYRAALDRAWEPVLSAAA